ncbi:uncharacterized protein LOC131168334 [Malania oleifera]|uniref:uncharacterized protein LOC131168334 n=1 Tax=Malania oleifera TaxID=397392 RepID=UPI0025AE0B56|nr:uncharacterized protein LOC131168334 [Malania oleifera]
MRFPRSQIGRSRALRVEERKLEMRFLWYCDLKEQEATLVELLNLMNLEMAHIDFLGREVSSMEDQNGVLGDMVVEFLRVADQNEFSRTENGLLQRKVKKLSRKMKKQSRVIGERNLNIKAIETEFLRTREELEMKTAMIKAFKIFKFSRKKLRRQIIQVNVFDIIRKI